MDDHDDLLQRLRHLGSQPIDLARQSADLTAMATARRGSRFGPKLRLAGVFLAGLLIGSTGLAAADALPDPAQHVAHTVLGRVGVAVADPDRYHDNAVCGTTEVKKNHGAYVRDDHSVAKTDCGKKLKAADASNPRADDPADPDADGPKPDKGPCHGKPAFSQDKTLTAEEKAAAQAKRVAQCGDVEVESPETAVEGSTTVEGPTTTDAPTTTIG